MTIGRSRSWSRPTLSEGRSRNGCLRYAWNVRVDEMFGLMVMRRTRDERISGGVFIPKVDRPGPQQKTHSTRYYRARSSQHLHLWTDPYLPRFQLEPTSQRICIVLAWLLNFPHANGNMSFQIGHYRWTAHARSGPFPCVITTRKCRPL